MERIYKKTCYFYMLDSKMEPRCSANRKLCLGCSFNIRRIDNLDLKDHLGLAYTRITVRRALLFSILSLVLSIVTLTLKVVDELRDIAKSRVTATSTSAASDRNSSETTREAVQTEKSQPVQNSEH